MYRIDKENLKSWIIILLMALSLAQVGILWDYQDHGFPFNFLQTFMLQKNISSLNSSSDEAIDRLKEDSFNPFRIIVSNGGHDDDHWILSRDRNQNSHYNNLWNQAKSYLKAIQSEKYKLVDSKWENIISQKGFTFEFKTNIPKSLLTYLLGSEIGSIGDFNGVHKIFIAPWDEFNYNSVAIYIMDGKQKIYRYTVNAQTQDMNKDKYAQIIEKFKGQNKLVPYKIAKGLESTFRSTRISMPPDLPIVVEGMNNFYGINYYIPQMLELKNPDLAEKAGIILGNEKESYEPSIDINDTFMLINTNNIYRLYSDGVLEYKYLPTPDEANKGSENEAFLRALEFIQKGKLIPEEIKDIYLYLSQIKSIGKDRYLLTFDYMVGEIPVFFNYKFTGREEKVLNNAITIEANSKRVLNCWWVVRDFELSGEKQKYSLNFVDLLDSAYKSNDLSSVDKFFMKDMNMSYEVTSSDGRNLMPSWIIIGGKKEEAANYYSVKMKEKGD